MIDELQEWENRLLTLGLSELSRVGVRRWKMRLREARNRVGWAETVQLVVDSVAGISVTNGSGEKLRLEKKRKLNWGWVHVAYRGETPLGVIYPWMEDDPEDGPKKRKVFWRFVGLDERLKNEEESFAELRKWVLARKHLIGQNGG